MDSTEFQSRIVEGIERIAYALESHNALDPLVMASEAMARLEHQGMGLSGADEGAGASSPEAVEGTMNTVIDLPIEGYRLHIEWNPEVAEGFQLYLLGPGPMARPLGWEA